jgi:PadR family transcriptional regulator, regulatory protein PadR
MEKMRRPMRESQYFVLVSLLGGPLHGYAVIRRAEELSGGRVRLATGTLYAALDHLTAEGDVELVGEETVSGRVRRSYGLTPRGDATLRAEAARGAESARLAEAARPVTGQSGDLSAGREGQEDESRATRLERRCRLLLLAYPAWYRRSRGEEMLGTLLSATAPGVSWPSFGDARTLITAGLRVRGWTSLLSMLWVAAGAVITGFLFYNSTKPYSLADASLGIPGWSTTPVAVQIAVVLSIVVWLALPLPALVAGFVGLRGWRPGNWFRAVAWAGAWIAGVALMRQAVGPWGTCPTSPARACGVMPRIGSPAVVSWGELAILAAWLVIGAVLAWLLAGQRGPYRRSAAPISSTVPGP